jgi:MerR family transcriptional regulator/heat shock protein HspR
MQQKPLYTISVIADLVGAHPETLRVWERHGLLKPPRRNAQRLYTDDDLKRLSCIRGLLGKGLNLAGVAYHLIFYPAGSMTIVRSACGSPPGRDVLSHVEGRRYFCQVSFEEQDLCDRCEHKTRSLGRWIRAKEVGRGEKFLMFERRG